MTTDALRATGQALLALQEADVALAEAEAALVALPQGKRVAALRAKQAEGAQRLAAIDARREEFGVQERRLQQDIEEIDAKLTAEQAKIEGTSDHREVQALTQELDLLAQRKNAIENETLECMQKRQDLSALRQDTEAKIAALASREQQEIAQYRKEHAELTEEINGAKSLVQEREAALDADLLARYQSLKGQKGGLAVARYAGGRCQTCSMQPPTGKRAEIEAGMTIEQCPSCGRLLVVEE